MKTFIFIFIFLLLHGAEGNALSAPPTPLPLLVAPGRTTILRVPTQGPIHLANGRLVRLQDLGDRLLITGKKPGVTELRAGGKIFEVRVTDTDAAALFSRLSGALAGTMGLSLGWHEGKPSIEGELLRWEDWQRAARAAGAGTYQFRAKMDHEIESEARAHFNELILRSRLSTPSIDLDGGASLAIPPGNSAQKKSYERLFAPFGFAIETDEKLTALEPMVEVAITVAEVRRKSFQKLGIQWPASATARLIPKPEWTTSAEAAVHALEERGLGKILASPKLLCRSGKEAQFLAGGEFPIKIMNFKINDVVWKKHGVLLKIKPVVDRDGRMSIALETEVSMIDSSQVVDGLPGLLTNRIQSHFDLERPETIALSGLIKNEWGRARSGLPGLAKVPILGQLFASEDYRENRTELIVFVSPRVIPVKGIGERPQLPEGWDDE
ncbi:MAG TPA: hypothetical protein VFV50_08015 [Bdellovibrionales bacterium]|nr:hypothetical protein [Bdellovibrionales bacterium]